MGLTLANSTPTLRVHIQDIRDELSRILLSRTFAKAATLRRLLEYIVSHWVETGSDGLDGYNLALAVFQRDYTFESALDPIVRVYTCRLRELLARYYVTEGVEDPLRISIPKGTYVPSISTAAQNTSQPARPENPIHIALLPFHIRNARCSQHKSYAMNILDHTMRHLSAVPAFRVLSRISASRVRAEMGEQLLGKHAPVDWLIEGAFTCGEEGFDVLVHLSEAKLGYILASRFYQHTFSDAHELSAQIAKELSHEILGFKKQCTSQPSFDGS
ncbi:MAG: repeat-containing protein [Acidobacteriaceae bacterium]|nr:repeat-containing protein [Acidobacteriaceae bacterium]